MALLCLTLASNANAGEVTIAVASNFLTTVQKIADEYQAETGHQIHIVNGSTGILYAQIMKGAPYDVYFSADQKRVISLADMGKLLDRMHKPYALGALVLYAREKDVLRENIVASLEADTLRHFAMADPATAPYGQAAKEVLERLDQRSVIEDKAVFGSNIGQTFGFVETGNAQIGFVALSQALTRGGDWLDIPANYHAPIVQEVGLLIHAKGNAPALDFYTYLSSAMTHSVLLKSGYRVPQ